ncbi:hypothetical protein [Fluviispira sanaruensis]|uniref:Delta-60 repeat domain-containing protein n=1 Tax=Fluviispira sanaruensis TaxID=2493639 RepID=A0A4P2VIX4_FLUSA|nr:hypothetical protein [Fluviispira sanaruensis]BBH53113.1 hypothetical protein JCM31447_15560 [Fluviispira sanaruensis]
MKIRQIKYSIFLSVLTLSLISSNSASASKIYNSQHLSHFLANSFATQTGELDETFGEKGVVKVSFGTSHNKFNKSIALLDGAILSAGSSVTEDNFTAFTLVKFNSDGTLDDSFGSNGVVHTKIGISSEILSISVLNDGSIIAFGKAALAPDQYQTVLASYQPDGTLNTSFGSSGIIVVDPSIVLASAHTISYNNAIILGGYSIAKTSRGANAKVFTIAKYDLKGNIVTKFGTQGVTKTQIGVSANVTSIHAKKDGLIIAAGVSQNADLNNQFTLAKYFSDGSLNKTFGQNGIVQTKIGNNANITSLSVGVDGSLFVGGYSIQKYLSESSYVITLAKYKPNGSLSNSFGTNGIVFTKILQNDYLTKQILQDDGSILAVGLSKDKTANNQFILAKYDPNGSLNTAFGQEGIVLGDSLDLDANFVNLTSTSEGSLFVSGESSGEAQAVLAKFN